MVNRSTFLRASGAPAWVDMRRLRTMPHWFASWYDVAHPDFVHAPGKRTNVKPIDDLHRAASRV